ncbi:hypothetical protein HGP28_04485 [Vibrio sp. SM6]|uniref:Uncharacterized protein n=1 Tax=Vibrio agarilyticus TaxID=2726741 RepID=A0A7X8TPC1_9VIBR|nr:hypothetical protein [Vibrio agarilyticus]NLS12151.1 hypothetical protein [Vibrio agarilyticus]
MLARWLPENKILKCMILSLTLYSIIVLIFAWSYGFFYLPDNPPSEKPFYKAYFDKPNWYLYPIFYLIIGFVVKSTWARFQNAWRQGAENGKTIIINSQGEKADKDAIRSITDKLNELRQLLIPIALIFSLIWSYFDGYETRQIYFEHDFPAQLASAEKDPDFTVKWIFSHSDKDRAEHLPAPTSQLIFYIMLEVEQFFLIGLGFLVLFQVLLQIFVFSFLDKLKIFSDTFSIELRYNSGARDFGLGEWNRAIDLFYWIISLGLIITLFVKYSQPPEAADVGIEMGKWALAALILLPFLATIAGRSRFVHQLDKMLEVKDCHEAWELRHNQSPWPLEPQRMQKVGFLLALALYSLFAGQDISTFIKDIVERSV